ncbi:MAG: Ldh family oxidoreductase [Syntrophales bacterium]|nr:Ldh family oxidoreductase [Syntrophales bacterium]
MPIFNPERLKRISYDILIKHGANDEESSIISRQLIEANLIGHDSHGIIQLATYIERVKKGFVVPGAKFEIEKETPTTAVINGNWGFGQVMQYKATQLAIEKAKKYMIAAVTVAYQGHIGTLNTYTKMAAAEGMIGQLYCDSGRGAKQVVPFGGRDARLGTNPICIALPSNLESPIFIDAATSHVAGGKVALCLNRHKPVPAGWLVDKEGNPSTDPSDFYKGGALMPMGGTDGGHKGYGLASMVEVFSGILTGLGWGVDPNFRHNDGSLFIAINVAAFRPTEEFKEDVTGFAHYLKSSRPAAGFKEVMYPGEIEGLTKKERLKAGVFIEDETWDILTKLAASVGVATD